MISLLETEGLTEPVRFSALVHKSEAQYFLKQYQASDTTLALALEPSKAYNDIYSHALYTKLRLIHARCALYRSAKTTDERQAREQLVNRFQCWSESTLIYKNILTVGLSQWTILASRDMKQTLDKFYASLENPPFPIGRRTQQELKKYREELVLVLKSDLKPKAEQTLDLIRNWVKGNEIYKDFVQLADTIHSKLKDPK